MLQQLPDLAQAKETLDAELAQAQKDFDAKTANMSAKEKQDYYNQTMQRLQLKEQELLAPIHDKIDAAIKSVADAKGVAVVFDVNNVVYGGQDLTADVVKKLTGK